MVRGARFGILFVGLVGLAVLGPFVKALSKEELYPNAEPGSSVLHVDSEGQLVSVEVILKTPIVFYDKVYNTIFVNGNGVLSFVRSMQRFFNIAFPLDDPVISPLYTHVDTRGSGTVHWGEIDSPGVLSRAGETVRNSFKDTQDFEPTHVFLVTWVDVGYFSEKSDKVNTYQVAISSNSTHSFVELLYPEGGIQWIQGESHPNGLPDARAQVGFMSEGRMYTLKGSGTDQIQNIDKWSNANNPGQWLFQVGPIPDGENVKIPDIEDTITDNVIPNCMTGITSCHSKANCVDYEVGFCCSCKQGFFGNGRFCQPIDVPLRVIGKISGTINGESFLERDLQCYVQTKDGRTYTALSRVPETLGPNFQLLGILGGIVGWLFAKPIEETKNGYQLTGGVFNHTADLLFTSSGEKVTIRSKFLGLDVFGQLKMEAEIKGSLPVLTNDARVDYDDHDELYTRSQSGTILSHSTRAYKIIGVNGVEYPFTQDQVIAFQECPYAPQDPEEDTTRLKFSRGVTTYEARERIVRFAMNTKIAPLEEEDPCIQGKTTCGEHSSCVVEGDGFKCVCNPGYQYLYEENGNAACVDINECTAGNHVCSPDAMCINNEGSHSCHCRTGYSGDGRYCEKLATCEDTRCPDYEQCSMMDGLPVCTCISGYENTENGCYPIRHGSCDVSNNCSPFGICSYDGDRQASVCTCLPGYLGDGYNCYSEADASTTMSSMDEAPLPQCVAMMCWCPSGWEYENDSCVKQTDIINNIDQVSCLEVDICDPNASCRTDEPLAKCVCNPGYEGDGTTCNPIDECNENSECDENQQCTYNRSTSRYECTCNRGFNMVDDRCVMADCSNDPSRCNINGQCVSQDGVYKCVCISGYHGDGVHQCVVNHIGCNVLNNCGRHAGCVYNLTSTNFVCACKSGFYGDGFTCLPQSSCRRDPSLCSPDATCVPAGEKQFACVCNEGHTGDGTDCRPIPKHDANILLLNQGMATLRIPFFPTPADPGSPIHISYTQMAIALDIDCPNGIAYSSDISGNQITSLTYNGSKADVFISGVSSPEGLSVDWMSRNIFWTDSGKSTLEVANLDTRKRKVLISDGLVNPRGIAVHPYRGKIFWSDWNRIAPKLEWANEDGTGRSFFLQGDHVKLPNSLAIDWSTDELCWADAGTFTISCVHIDTKEVHVVASELSYPFGLAISHNYYYWTDWKTHKIEIVSKISGEKKKPLSVPPGGSGKLYGIVAVPETCPRVSNVCQYDNGRCNENQLCLPDGQGGRTCACADDASDPCTDSRYS